MSDQILIDLYAAALTGVLAGGMAGDPEGAARTAMQHAIKGQRMLLDNKIE